MWFFFCSSSSGHWKNCQSGIQFFKYINGLKAPKPPRLLIYSHFLVLVLFILLSCGFSLLITQLTVPSSSKKRKDIKHSCLLYWGLALWWFVRINKKKSSSKKRFRLSQIQWKKIEAENVIVASRSDFTEWTFSVAELCGFVLHKRSIWRTWSGRFFEIHLLSYQLRDENSFASYITMKTSSQRIFFLPTNLLWIQHFCQAFAEITTGLAPTVTRNMSLSCNHVLQLSPTSYSLTRAGHTVGSDYTWINSDVSGGPLLFCSIPILDFAFSGPWFYRTSQMHSSTLCHFKYKVWRHHSKCVVCRGAQFRTQLSYPLKRCFVALSMNARWNQRAVDGREVFWWLGHEGKKVSQAE